MSRYMTQDMRTMRLGTKTPEFAQMLFGKPFNTLTYMLQDKIHDPILRHVTISVGSLARLRNVVVNGGGGDGSGAAAGGAGTERTTAPSAPYRTHGCKSLVVGT